VYSNGCVFGCLICDLSHSLSGGRGLFFLVQFEECLELCGVVDGESLNFLVQLVGELSVAGLFDFLKFFF